MRTSSIYLATLCLIASPLGAAEPDFRFRDVAEEAGLFPDLAAIAGHGAGWGDVDGDGWADLYVGTFGGKSYQSKPNQLFLNKEGKFKLDQQPALRLAARTTGVIFADLDNDGDLDLYVGSMPISPESKAAERQGVLSGCALFRNEGGGRFTNISTENGACPPAFGGRSAAALDFDGDGLLDLLVGEDPIPGYNGSTTKSARLFRNRGELQFEDVSRAAGLPEGIPALGVAAADFNNDTWPDFFLACSGEEGNRLFLNDGQGKFHEAPGSREVFAWPTSKGDDMCCGVAVGDVNRDGMLDVVLGQHYSRPWQVEVRNRLYLNRGVDGGVPRFEDVTESAGLVPLPMKSPHVEIQDFDNDGWPDIYFSVVKFDAAGQPHPLVFKHEGLKGGAPHFRCRALAVNDFPTAEDLAVKRTGEFFDRMIARRQIVYMAPGPTADFDRDGRLDMLLANWWTAGRSLLLRNETAGGNWLEVALAGPAGVNAQGIGARINIYAAATLEEDASPIASREMAVGYGYASGQEAVAHFGLGDAKACDIEIIWPHGRGRLKRQNIASGQRVAISSADEAASGSP